MRRIDHELCLSEREARVTLRYLGHHLIRCCSGIKSNANVLPHVECPIPPAAIGPIEIRDTAAVQCCLKHLLASVGVAIGMSRLGEPHPSHDKQSQPDKCFSQPGQVAPNPPQEVLVDAGDDGVPFIPGFQQPIPPHFVPGGGV